MNKDIDSVRSEALKLICEDIGESIKKRNKIINYKPAEYVKIAGDTYRSENEIIEAYGCGTITASQEEYGLARLQSKRKEELVEVNTIARDLLVDLESIAKDQLLNAQGTKSQMVRLEHAHWIMINGEHCECSNCRTVVSTDQALNHKTRYCMCCGARMDEEAGVKSLLDAESQVADYEKSKAIKKTYSYHQDVLPKYMTENREAVETKASEAEAEKTRKLMIEMTQERK